MKAIRGHEGVAPSALASPTVIIVIILIAAALGALRTTSLAACRLGPTTSPTAAPAPAPAPSLRPCRALTRRRRRHLLSNRSRHYWRHDGRDQRRSFPQQTRRR
jgi:hypothetical protein